MFYKDKKEILNFLGEWATYAYIFSAFFNSKINMKIGYLLLIVSFFYICFNRDIIKLVNKKIYGMLLLILVLGSIWNYISADMIGMSKFLNINTRFFNESYVYHLLDDLGRIRAILLIGWIYTLIYTFEKISEDFKKYIFLLLTSILPFIALGKSGSRAGALSLFLIIFLYLIFKVFKEKKSIKFVSIIAVIILLTGLFLPKEYKERLKTSFQTTENISNEDRIVMWKAGIEIFKENPIFGIGSYKKGIYPHVQKYVEENVNDEQLRGEFINRDRFAKLHNMYIDFFVQNGILGLLYLVFLFVLIPFEFFKSEKNKESIAAFFSMIFYCSYGLTWSLWSSLGISQALFHTFLIWMLVNLKRKNL